MALRRGIVSLFAIFSACPSGPIFAQAHPGFQPYTPSRIQWLATDANASFRHASVPNEPYSLVIIISDPETLTVTVGYDPVLDQANSSDFSPKGITLQAARNGMVASIKTAKAGIQAIAKASGWTWLKVKEDVKNYKQAMDNP